MGERPLPRLRRCSAGPGRATPASCASRARWRPGTPPWPRPLRPSPSRARPSSTRASADHGSQLDGGARVALGRDPVVGRGGALAGRRRDVPAQPDEREHGHERDRGEDAGADAAARERHRPPRRRRAREHADGAREGGQGDRGHLPVPVGARVQQVGGEAAECDRDERLLAGAHAGDQRRGQTGDEQEQADRPEVGERLQVQVVRVLHLEPGRAVLEVVGLVRPRPRAEHLVALVVVPGDPPQVGAGVARQAEEAQVEVAAGVAGGALEAAGRRRVEAVVHVAGDRDRRSEPHHRDEDQEHHRRAPVARWPIRVSAADGWKRRSSRRSAHTVRRQPERRSRRAPPSGGGPRCAVGPTFDAAWVSAEDVAARATSSTSHGAAASERREQEPALAVERDRGDQAERRTRSRRRG